MSPGFFQSMYNLHNESIYFRNRIINFFPKGFQYEFPVESTYNPHYHRHHHHRYHSLIHWIKFRFRNRLRLIFTVCLSIIILISMYIGGVFVYPFETTFNEENFHYPIYSKDFRYFIESAKQNLSENALKPINNYSFHYHLNPVYKCQQQDNFQKNSTFDNNNSPITLLLVIKSATCNFLQRIIIRQTWGNEQRFSDVKIRTVFMLGECSSIDCPNEHHPTTTTIMFTRKSQKFIKIFNQNQTIDCQRLIDIENQFYRDIVQADFIDSYYNNTKKTMSSLQWTAKNCNQVPFILFVDDDYYISIKNLLKFSRNYLRFIMEPTTEQFDDSDLSDNQDIQQAQVDWLQHRQQYDGRLYVGYLFPNSHPLRHLTSKWYISLNEYEWNQYPPYITGGCFLVNNQTLIDLYYSSLYSESFKYDDVYLGILAYRMNIKLIDLKQQISFYSLKYDWKKFSKLIGSHGFHDPNHLWQIWNEQKSLGYA